MQTENIPSGELRESGKILSLDVGEKTIGCAVAGDEGIAPEPLPVIVRRDGALSLGALRRIISAYRVDTIVVGLPLREGKQTSQSRKTRGFVAKLKKHFPTITVLTQDETLTTWSAKKNFSRLKLKKTPANRSPINVDSFAAREILEHYFENRH